MAHSEDSAQTRPLEILAFAGESLPEVLPVTAVQFQAEDPLPRSLGLMPLRGMVLFPEMVTPLVISQPRSIKVAKRAISLGEPVFFVTQRSADLLEADRDDLYDVGTVGRVLRALRFADGTLRVLVQGLQRARLGAATSDQPFFQGAITAIDSLSAATPRAEILRRHLRDDFRFWCRTTGKGPPELESVVESLEEPGRLADYVAGNLPVKTEELQQVISESDVERRLVMVRELLNREREIAELNMTIIGNVQSARDRSTQGGLADARRAGEAQDRAPRVGVELAHAQVLEDALFDLLEAAVVVVEDLLDHLEVVAVVAAEAPGHVQEPVDVGA